MFELSAANSVTDYIENNNQFLIDSTLSEYLNRLCADKGLVKADVIRKAEMNDIYAYQIFSGVRMPSRDKLVCLCIGMGLNVFETNQLLKYAGFAALYPKNKRDSVILFGLERGQGICDINQALFDVGARTLG